MRLLLFIALFLSGSSELWANGILISGPSVELVAEAREECDRALSKKCLFVLALNAAAGDGKPVKYRLFEHVHRQLQKRGELEGLEFLPEIRTTVDDLLAQSRWSEAETLLWKQSEGWTLENNSVAGVIASQLVAAQLTQGEVDLAVTTAKKFVSFPLFDERSGILRQVLRYHLERGEFSRALELVPVFNGSNPQSLALFEIGKELAARNMDDAAKDVIQRIVVLEPDDRYLEGRAVQAHLTLARAQVVRGDLSAARETLRHAADLEKVTRQDYQIQIDFADLLIRTGQNRQAQTRLASAIWTTTERVGRESNSGFKNSVSEKLSLAARYLVLADAKKEGEAAFQQAWFLLEDAGKKNARTRLVYHVNRALAYPGDIGRKELRDIERILKNIGPIDFQTERVIQQLLDSGYRNNLFGILQVLAKHRNGYFQFSAILHKLMDSYLEKGQFAEAKEIALHDWNWSLRNSLVFSLCEKVPPTHARRILLDLKDWAIGDNPEPGAKIYSNRISFLADLAKAQIRLKFQDDGQASLRQAYKLAETMDGLLKANAFLNVAGALEN